LFQDEQERATGIGMKAGTHIIAGVMVGYAVGASAGLPLWESGALGAIGGLAAMLPDIDHPQSAIRRKTGVLGTLAAFWMKHRGITHSIAATLLVWAVCALFSQPLISAAVVGGYASHLLLDGCTPAGVPLFWPNRTKVHLLPSGLRVRTGGFAERGVALAMVALLFVSAWRG